MRTRGQFKTALVLGLGASGEAAAHLLRSEGSRVCVVDADDNPALRQRARRLRDLGARVILGCRNLPKERFSIAVASPGIPEKSPWMRSLERSGVKVLAELELGWMRCRARVLGITGSNGKSTVVKLCAESLTRGGGRAVAAGNYGTPLCRVVREYPDAAWAVAEVSSFQLERVSRFRPDVGVLLNIYPNHLDRHGDMRSYARLKARMFARMGPTDVRIIHEGAAGWLPAARRRRGRWTTFGLSPAADYRYESGRVTWQEKDNPGLDVLQGGSISVAHTIFDNEILGLSAAAAVAAVRACGGQARDVERAAREFEPLPHRMQDGGEIDGVAFMDNSKATNLAAVAASLEMVKKPVRLIAGGLLKEGNLESVTPLLLKKARGVYLIGKAANQFADAWGKAVPCRVCSDLREAVVSAWNDAERGDAVLLSPGCASFDQFANFEDRGNRFLSIVNSLKRKRKERGRA
jgi:UDP-N-acetylmuramoylalanine--D-glutamate ligase